MGVIKKGYYVDLDSGYFLPDTENWKLLRQAVEMRLKERKTNQEVAEFLNSSGFSYRKYQDEPYNKSKLNKKTVAKLLSDPLLLRCLPVRQELRQPARNLHLCTAGND